MYEDINLFALNFPHFFRKGILSEQYFNVLRNLKILNQEDKLTPNLKTLICDEILLKCLQKKVSGPFDHIVNFYRQYSRHDVFDHPGFIGDEILIHPRLFFLLKDLSPFLKDHFLNDQIVDQYYRVRSKLEIASQGDFTLYHVLIHPDFKIFIESLRITIQEVTP